MALWGRGGGACVMAARVEAWRGGRARASFARALPPPRTIMDILCSEGWRLKMTTSPLIMWRSTRYPGCR